MSVPDFISILFFFRHDDDVIRCPCGQYKDEGEMVQCEKCSVWQHCDCVGHKSAEEKRGCSDKIDEDEQVYLCELCSDNNKVNLDIVMTPSPEYASPGETHHVSLLRDDLQLKIGDTVYVLRALDEKGSPKKGEKVDANNKAIEKPDDPEVGGVPTKMMSPSKGPSMEASAITKENYPTYKTVDPASPLAQVENMDIFRIERLWTDDQGRRFAFGHHYLRPHETFHEPSRKFFHNEVFRVPLHEVLPLDTIWGQCWVMDPATFVAGRPKGAVEEHVYLCELRVDKGARLFNRISKPKYAICTKSVAFDAFEQRLPKPLRSYEPHKVPEKYRSSSTPRNRSVEDSERGRSDSSSRKSSASRPAFVQPWLPKVTKMSAKALKESNKAKLNRTLDKLLDKHPKETRVDASYLLENDKRLRKKSNLGLTPLGLVNLPPPPRKASLTKIRNTFDPSPAPVKRKRTKSSEKVKSDSKRSKDDKPKKKRGPKPKRAKKEPSEDAMQLDRKEAVTSDAPVPPWLQVVLLFSKLHFAYAFLLLPAFDP